MCELTKYAVWQWRQRKRVRTPALLSQRCFTEGKLWIDRTAYGETVSVNVAVCTALPEVAVTVTVTVPAGVPGLLGVD